MYIYTVVFEKYYRGEFKGEESKSYNTDEEAIQFIVGVLTPDSRFLSFVEQIVRIFRVDPRSNKVEELEFILSKQGQFVLKPRDRKPEYVMTVYVYDSNNEIGEFTAPLEWIAKKAKEIGYDNLTHFYDNYTYTEVEGWYDQAKKDKVLIETEPVHTKGDN